MASFLTEFPIRMDKSIDELFRLSFRWFMGMKNPDIPRSSVRPPENFDDFVLKSQQEGEAISFQRAAHEGMEIGGVQYAKHDEQGRRWLTEVVGAKSKTDFWVSIRVASDSTAPSPWMPAPKRPYIIKMMMMNEWGALDGSLATTDKPRFLNDDEIDLATSLVLGEFDNHLPIVYVSVDFEGEFAVDPERLAMTLGGLAHVFVEPNRPFSHKLASATGYVNPYGGAIGVYWPATAAHRRYLPRDFSSENDLESAIKKDVTLALANRRAKPDCSWQFLQELVSRRALAKLKEEGSTDLNEWMEAFEKDQRAKDDLIREKEERIGQLNDELRHQLAEMRAREAGPLKYGKETDFYDAERKLVTIRALEHARNAFPEGTRRRHIIDDLVQENAGNFPPEGEKLEQAIKNALRNYSGMDAKLRATLKNIGFSITEDGKHFKIKFNDDNRYAFSFPKSPSDHRGGKNLVSDICKKLF